MTHQMLTVRPVLLFTSADYNLSSLDRQLLTLAFDAGLRPLLCPWFRIRTNGQGTWVCNAIEMSTNNQIKSIAEWENINPRLIWHRWKMTGIGRMHFQNLVEQNPDALISYCPADTELREWTSLMRSKIAKHCPPTHVGKS